MFPSTSNEADPMAATSASVGYSDPSRTVQSYARLAFAALLAWLTWIAFHNEYGYVPIVTDVSTAIHEFGHMLFMPFGIPILGRTMVILGGSLTEVAFPLLFVGYFLRKREDGRRRDVFAAMVCLWWSAIGLLATAIYCADSRAGKLMLLDGLTGQESDGHDWYNLLDRWGLLEHDTQIARWMRMIAWLMCVGSIAVAAWSALQFQQLEQPGIETQGLDAEALLPPK
jgi:TRAP-type C4-dicarboxylate transport system permease small subunit